MASIALAAGRLARPRASRWEFLMVMLAVAHAVVLFQIPVAPVIALGVWWNSNTISHNFIHRPFFRPHAANLLFGAYLSVLLGIPQSLWRDRHLAHHAGIRPRLRLSAEFVLQAALVLALWIGIAVRSPRFFLSVYLPGYLAGVALCAVHGYYEHAHGLTSHYGRLYNFLFFNDGCHAEHHANPATHWTRLPDCPQPTARVSAWPAPLRWMEAFNLETLERLVLRSPWLQRFVLRAHARAFRQLIGALPTIGRIAIVGGGLFPRTALILARLLPTTHITIIDSSRAHLDQARRFLGRSGDKVEFVHARYPQSPSQAYDLLIIPLSFRGDRDALYARPPAPAVIVHDWIWRNRGAGQIVSISMLKRINLVRP